LGLTQNNTNRKPDTPSEIVYEEEILFIIDDFYEKIFNNTRSDEASK
jgi:hypothetical protein